MRAVTLLSPQYRLWDLKTFQAFSPEKIPGSPAPSNIGRKQSIERSEVRGEDMKHDLHFLA